MESAAAACVEFDLGLAGVDGSAGSAVSPVSEDGLDFGSASTILVSFGAASDSVVLVWAPPLLLTVTPDPASVLDDVVPDSVAVPVDVAPVADGVDGSLDDVLLDVDASLVELDAVDSEDVPVVSAADTP